MASRQPREITRYREMRAWELRQQMWTQKRIADELGICHQAVSKILKRIDERFLAKADELIAEQKAAQTEQLRYIADEALQAWERSKRNAETVTTKETDNGTEVTTRVQGQYGDPRLLDQARGALADIRTLWGLDAPKRLDATISPIAKVYEGLDVDRV